MRRSVRQRGTVYVLVLGVVSLLVVMGLSGAYLARGTVQRSNLEQDQIKARHLALAALDVRHHQINGDSNWRPNAVTSWGMGRNLGDGVVLIKHIDEIDGDLTNDASQPFRLYVMASVGDAVRVYSQEFLPGESDNLLPNPKSLRQEPAN